MYAPGGCFGVLSYGTQINPKQIYVDYYAWCLCLFQNFSKAQTWTKGRKPGLSGKHKDKHYSLVPVDKKPPFVTGEFELLDLASSAVNRAAQCMVSSYM